VSEKPKAVKPAEEMQWPLKVDYGTMGLSDIELMSDEEYARAVARDNGEEVPVESETSPSVGENSGG
jgi:hypothetical protein